MIPIRGGTLKVHLFGIAQTLEMITASQPSPTHTSPQASSASPQTSPPYHPHTQMQPAYHSPPRFHHVGSCNTPSTSHSPLYRCRNGPQSGSQCHGEHRWPPEHGEWEDPSSVQGQECLSSG